MNAVQTDIERFLQPISDTVPAGCDIEYEAVFEQISQARESDEGMLPDSAWECSARSADWSQVSLLCQQVLETQSKDLQIACWLTQSLGELYSLEGMVSGLTLIHRLLTSFWPTLWPKLDEDAEEPAQMRLSRLQWLDATLSMQLDRLPLTDDALINLSVWQLVQYFERRIAVDSGVRAALMADGYFGMDECDSSIRASSAERLMLKIEQVEQLNMQLDTLRQTVDELFSGAGEMMGTSRQRLQEICELLRRFRDVVAPELALGAENITAMGNVNPGFNGNGLTESGEHHQTRSMAIGQLLKIAHYFRCNEPTSPVPYLLERAARWANMGMEEWLKEMMEDNNAAALREIILAMKGRESDNTQGS
ncbi:type VI secretion system-associated protein (plasmid) [Serratia marcescens]|nr:type VI secretion system-associated protein [Serratia marcescens]